jgi:L-ascorbate metabolism protein UlaG (beta-lactamase superfamily)
MDSLKVRDAKITWLGHATFTVDWQGGRACFDPFLLPPSAPKAACDLVLVTHEHFDHCNPEKLARVSNASTTVVCGPNCAAKFSQLNLKTTELTAGQSATVAGVKIIAVPAYNVAKPFHPRGLGVGFVADFGGVKIYHAGDTDHIPEMKSFAAMKIDVALLPIGGHYTMDSEEAARAANDIAPAFVVPMHYGTMPEIKGDVKAFAALVEKKTKVVELEPLK